MFKIARLAFIAASFFALAGAALAQPSGPSNPGPVPPPSPWTYAVPIAYLPAGSCITLPQSVAGGCMGSNTINAQGLFVSGKPLVSAGAVAPLGGLPLYASPTGTGNCLSAGAGSCALATACSYVRQIATFIGAAGPINLADGSGGSYATADANNNICTIFGNSGGSSSQLVSIQGNAITPTNVVISLPGGAANGFSIQDGAEAGINNLEITAVNGSGAGIIGRQLAVCDYGNIYWGAWGNSGSHVAGTGGASCNMTGGGETFLANLNFHWNFSDGAHFTAGGTTHIPSAVTWNQFAQANGSNIDLSSWTHSGSGDAGSSGPTFSGIGFGRLLLSANATCTSLMPGNGLNACQFTGAYQDSFGDKQTDANFLNTIMTLGTGLSLSGITVSVQPVTINGVVCQPGSSCTITATAASVTVGTTTVLSGTPGRILYDNAGVLGEATVTGSLGSVVLSIGPTFSGTVTMPDGGTWSGSGITMGATIYGGTAAGSGLNLASTSNGSPSGDSIALRASTILLRNIGSGTSVVEIGIGGTTPGQLQIASPTANVMTIQNAASATGAATIPSGTYTFVGDTLSQTLTNKSLTSPTITGSFTATGLVTAADLFATTGTGSVVLSASPTLTGTINAVNLTLSGVLKAGAPSSINGNTAAVPAGIGNAPVLVLQGQDSAGGNGITIYNHSDASELYLVASLGTGASPTLVTSGTRLGRIYGYGFDGTNYDPATRISFAATQDFSPTHNGGQILFYTTPNNSTTLTLALTIDQNQSLTAAGPVSASNLSLGGALTTSAALTTTGTGAPTLAFPSSPFTYTFPGAAANLAYQVGSLTSGDCLQASGTAGGIADAGAACGSGSSTITAGTTATSGIASGNIISSTSNLVADSGVAVSNVALLGGSTFTGAVVVSGASFGLSGNISAAAWTTSGVRYKNVASTLTDTTSSGTVAAAYTDVFGGNTIAASSATTFTNYTSLYVKNPVVGSNATFTTAYALGADSLNIVGGTLGNLAQVLNITATQPASNVAQQNAIVWTINGAGSASFINRAFVLNYNAGYTGSSTTNAASFNNANAGTGSTLIAAAGNAAITGNLASNATSTGTTTGLNVGTGGAAAGGNTNVGLIGLSQGAKNSATNIAVVGSAINTGSSPVQIGGWFSLNQTTVPTVSAALIADNGAQSNPIAIFMAAGVNVASINSTGGITGTLTNVATTSAVCYNTSTGLLTYDGTLGTCTVSTMRVKHDIRPLATGSLLDGVLRMQPDSFFYNDDQHTPGQQLGLMAEDLAAIDGRLVSYDDQGRPNAIRFLGPMAAYLIGSIKELKADNDNLRAELKAVRARR